MLAASTEELLARLIERVEGRYYGKYRGLVTDNADPSNLGRIQAQVPRLLGAETSGWALPAFPYGGASQQGFFALPDVGAGVWIEFEGGDLSYPVWTGTWYTTGAIPESAQAGQKVLKTSSGHKIVLDDDAGSLAITDSNNNVIQMNSTSIQITAGNATQVVIDAPAIQLVNGASHPLVFGDQLLQYLNTLVQT
ncbi:MAG TPA: phage baseplate assembly protein V, partial [Acidobacteriaceae bacterium]